MTISNNESSSTASSGRTFVATFSEEAEVALSRHERKHRKNTTNFGVFILFRILNSFKIKNRVMAVLKKKNSHCALDRIDFKYVFGIIRCTVDAAGLTKSNHGKLKVIRNGRATYTSLSFTFISAGLKYVYHLLVRVIMLYNIQS